MIEEERNGRNLGERLRKIVRKSDGEGKEKEREVMGNMKGGTRRKD